MPETSTREVAAPRRADFILVLLYQPECSRQALWGQPVVLRELNHGIEPELRLPGGVLNMNVGPAFLSGEKKNRYAPLRKTVGLIGRFYRIPLVAPMSAQPII